MTSGTETRDHWYWRPDRRKGRSVHTWHLLVDDQSALHDFAAEAQPELEATSALGPIPIKWLQPLTSSAPMSVSPTPASAAHRWHLSVKCWPSMPRSSRSH